MDMYVFLTNIGPVTRPVCVAPNTADALAICAQLRSNGTVPAGQTLFYLLVPVTPSALAYTFDGVSVSSTVVK